MVRRFIAGHLLVSALLGLGIPISRASSGNHGDFHSSEGRTRGGGAMSSAADSKRVFLHPNSDEDGTSHHKRDHIKANKESNMLLPSDPNFVTTLQTKGGDSNGFTSRLLEATTTSLTPRKTQVSIDAAAPQAALTTDKTSYYDGELIQVTYELTQDNVKEGVFYSWMDVFPLDVYNYSKPKRPIYTSTEYGTMTSTVTFPTRLLPAVNSKYKVVMAIADSEPLHVLGVSDSFDVMQDSAVLVTDKILYYEGVVIEVTFIMREDVHNLEDRFAWIGLFANNVSDYSLPLGPIQYANDGTGSITGTITLSTRNLPVLNSKYKAVMAIRDSDPIRVIGVTASFDVIANSATLTTAKTHYYEGEWIDVTFTMSPDSDNIEADFIWVGLFAHNVTDYSLPPVALRYIRYRVTVNTGTITLSSTNLPGLNSKYKAVMVIVDSVPPRIMGVSDSFDIMTNSAALTTDETKYYEGELIDVTYTLNENAEYMNCEFAWVGLFAHNVLDYSIPPFNLQYAGYSMAGNIGTISLSSRNLPQLNSKYKIVMAITDSDPPRILGVSDSFDILPNSAALTTDDTQYYDGEVIDVTFTLSQDVDNIEDYFAWVGLFAHNVSDYSLPPAARQYVEYTPANNSGTISLYTTSLPEVNSKYKAVMAITDSYPPHILGVSDSFDVLEISATLTTDETKYYEGELIDVTFTLSQDSVITDFEFARIGLFAFNESDYSAPLGTTQFVGYWSTTSESTTISFSSRNLPQLNYKYKAVMVVSGSDPPRILGMSDSFDVLENSATLTTDNTRYFDGNSISVTFTLSQDADNMEVYFAWVGLFAHTVSDYSLPPAARQDVGYRSTGNSGTVLFYSTNLPGLNSKYKAVMVIADSYPPRILGVSDTFDVLKISATLTTDETKYYEGELIDVTYTLNQDGENRKGGYAWVGLFAHNVLDYSIPPFNLQYAGYGMTATPLRLCPNSAALTTDDTQYYDGEVIDVTYTIREESDNLEYNFAWVGLFAHNVSDYSLPPAALQNVEYTFEENSGKVSFYSKELPELNSKYKAVMAITDSYPPHILGVSDTIDVLEISATLTTDETKYYEEELIDVTFTLSQDSVITDFEFAWIGLFAFNESDYSAPLVTTQFVGYWSTTSENGTIFFSSSDLPLLNYKYKAVMVVSGSDPPRILGVSDSFDVLENSATLTTDNTRYFDGESIYVTFTLSQDSFITVDNYARIGLFAFNESDYSAPLSSLAIHRILVDGQDWHYFILQQELAGFKCQVQICNGYHKF
ncbi:cell adhesion [Fragilaria crotonensis]|nr:cell adhesion [Fragilaria crotonensis]